MLGEEVTVCLSRLDRTLIACLHSNISRGVFIEKLSISVLVLTIIRLKKYGHSKEVETAKTRKTSPPCFMCFCNIFLDSKIVNYVWSMVAER